MDSIKATFFAPALLSLLGACALPTTAPSDQAVITPINHQIRFGTYFISEPAKIDGVRLLTGWGIKRSTAPGERRIEALVTYGQSLSRQGKCWFDFMVTLEPGKVYEIFADVGNPSPYLIAWIQEQGTKRAISPPTQSKECGGPDESLIPIDIPVRIR